MRLIFAFLLLLFQPKFSTAIVGSSAQLVDNEGVMIEKPLLKKETTWPRLPVLEEPKPGDIFVKFGFWLLIASWVSLIVLFSLVLWLFVEGLIIYWAFGLTGALFLLGFVLSRVGKKRETNFRRLMRLNAVLFWIEVLVAIVAGSLAIALNQGDP